MGTIFANKAPAGSLKLAETRNKPDFGLFFPLTCLENSFPPQFSFFVKSFRHGFFPIMFYERPKTAVKDI
jgi:hypothetical protein